MTAHAIAVVLPMREQVAGGRAGAVALNVSEYGCASVYRERLLVLGGADPGDFVLPYRRVHSGRGIALGASWPFLRGASGRYADSVVDAISAEGCVLAEVHNRARLFNRLAKRLGARVRLCLHLHNDPQGMEGLRTTTERAWLLQRASFVYCVSDYIRRRFTDGLDGPLERVVILPNGVGPLPMDRPKRQQTILFVGRLIPEKGADELCDALTSIARQLPDWRAVIVGRAPERHRARYQRKLRDLRAVWGERLLLAESLPHAEVMQAFCRAAITIVPSRWQEPFGRTALEALAMGSAVIASRSGGLPEIVGEAGLLLDAVTPDAIGRAILTLARDPARRDALGKAGEARATTCFAIGTLSRRLDTWRSSLLAG